MNNKKLRWSLGERIAAYRRKYGWSQEELAERVGISRNQIGRIERGESRPKYETVRSMEDALGISPMSLLEKEVGYPADIEKAFERFRVEMAKKNLTKEELLIVLNAALCFAETLHCRK